jgi:hypothetical protein
MLPYRIGVTLALLMAFSATWAQLVAPPPQEAQIPRVEEYPAFPIDTYGFDKQIDTTFKRRDREPENPILPEWLRAVIPPNNMPVGQASLATVPKPRAKFPAINATGWVPPDPTLAVGPNHVIGTVNSSIAFFDKTGNIQLQQTFETMFSGMGAGSFLFDPRCFYDRLTQRYFVTVIEQDDASQTSKVLIGVSDDSDPNGTWFRYRLDSKFTNNGSSFWLDYPGFGYNKDAVVVTGNLFGFAGGFAGVYFLLMPKTPMLSGQTVTVSYLRDSNAFTYQMAEIWDPTETRLFGASDFNSATAKLCVVTSPTSNPQLATQFVSVPSFSYPSQEAPSPSNRSLDPSDGRYLSCGYRDGRLVTCQTVDRTNDTTNRVRWTEFDVSTWPSPTLRQSGEIAPTVAGEHFFMPAVAQNGAGDIAALFSRSSSSIVADIMVTTRRFGDPLGAMGVPTLLQSSAGSTYGSGGSNRWGDYVSVVVDPIDDRTFWGIGMAGQNGNWRTHIFSWALESAALKSVTVSPSSVTGGLPSTGTVLLTTAAPASGLTVSLSSNNAVVTVPTSVTVPAGSTSATFTVNTTATNSNRAAVITGSHNGISATANLTVLAPVIASVTLDPATVVGGVASTGTVTFTGPSPAGGANVGLSSNSSSATVPTSVMIPAGATSAQFTITTSPTTSTRSVTIKAARGASSATATLTVNAPLISGLALSPTSVIGGTSSTGEVTLTGAAPTGGLTVYFSSNSSSATVPTSLVIPAGASARQFTINTSATSASRSVTIKVVRGTSSAVATLQVAAPTITSVSLSPSRVTGGSSSTATVTLSGPAPTGGLNIGLSSSSSSAPVPPSVIVPAGSNKATFTINTKATVSDRAVTIKAARGTNSATATLTVLAPVVAGFSVSPATVTGGSQTTATVTLSGPAPTGGVSIGLSSNSSRAPVPPSVIVPQGATQVSFTINTLPTPDDRTVTLKAARGSSSATTTLTVKK